MAKLAAWSIDSQHGEGGSLQWEPQRVGRSPIRLERDLEDWIVNDVRLANPEKLMEMGEEGLRPNTEPPNLMEPLCYGA